MFFRPEEVHGTSGEGYIFGPFVQRNRHMPDQSLGITFQNYPVFDIHVDRFTTIETGGFKMDYFTWEKPANCWRFESSLGKPFLLAIDGDSVLIW
jgi:hypothetical protein